MAGLSCHALPRLRMQDHPVYSGNDPAGRLPDARFFPFPLSFLLLRMRAHVSPVWGVLCALLWWLIQFTLPTLFAISIPWKLQGESQSADRFHKIVSHPIMAIGRSLLEAAPALFLLYYLGL